MSISSAVATLPPGPRLPTLLQTRSFWEGTNSFLAGNRDRHGPVYRVRVQPWGRAVVIDDTDLVKQVFTGDPAVYHAGEGNSLLAPVLGRRSVLVLDEQEHLQTRRRLLPSFHGESVRRYGEVVERLVSEEVARWPVDRPFELHPRMHAVTLEVILHAVIGVTDPVRRRELREALPAAVPTHPSLPAMWIVPGLERIGRWRRYSRAIDRANRLLRDEIADRRLERRLEERHDVLSQLVLAGDLDDEELRDQIMTLLIAGHETTASGLAWAFERLLRHPEALERARQGEDAYLDAVVQETLRVRSVISVVLRRLTEPVELGGWTLPRGTTLMPAIHLLHSDPALFPEPERFRPERFLEGPPGTYSWIPFGGGTRRCLGAAFATFEMRVALRTILAQADLRPDDPSDEPVGSNHITRVPGRGATVVMAERRRPESHNGAM